MLEIFTFLNFIFWIFGLLFLPGLFFFLAFKRKNWKISFGEILVFSLGLSLFIIDFSMIGLGILGVKITAFSSVGAIFLITLVSISVFFLKKEFSSIQEKVTASNRLTQEKELLSATQKILPFDIKMKIGFLLVLVLILLPRFFYIQDKIAPTATDLGHHMYWSKYISQTGKLPDYSEAVIEKADLGKFIIGEHLIFSLLNLTSGETFWGPMPPLLLLLFNVFSVFALAFLGLNLFSVIFNQNNRQKLGLFFLISLLFLGVFNPISSPQAKYVVGGVVGNVLGNFLIPLTFLFLTLAIKFRSSRFFSLTILSAFTLAYTHHLSAFVFIYSLLGAVLLFFILLGIEKLFNQKNTIFKDFLSPIFSLLNFSNLLLILFLVIFILFIFPPSYLNSSVIGTAVGAPSKETRVGLDLGIIAERVSSWGFLFGILGFFVVSLRVIQNLFPRKEKFKKKDLSGKLVPFFSFASIILGWFLIIFLASFKPELLKINILSVRVVTYLSFSAMILSSFFVFWFLEKTRQLSSNIFLFKSFFILIFVSGFMAGTLEIPEYYKEVVQNKQQAIKKTAWQTFVATDYLAQRTTRNDIILKDHIYLTGDSWMKVIFMRGYKYPLSRSYLNRYENKNRETCTRDMILIPDSETGKRCFKETGTRYIVLKRGKDDSAFINSPSFSRIFSSDEIVIFKKNE